MDVSNLTEAFETVYADGRWGAGLGSGHGSRPWATIMYRRFLERFLRANGVGSVIDLGCGDWSLGRLVNWGDVTYLGLDVVPALVERNQRRYGAPRRTFMVPPSAPTDVPEADLLIIKDVLQHLPLAAIQQILDEFVPRCRMTLIIDDQPGAPEETNQDIEPGGWRRIDVRRPPFDQPGTVIQTLIMLPYVTRTLQHMHAGRKTVTLLRPATT